MAFLAESVIGALIEFVVQKPLEGAWEKGKRSDRVLLVLQKFGLDPDKPPDDSFDTLYTYAVVKWGVFKQRELLQLFRDADVRTAFERSLQADDPDVWRAEVSDIVEAKRAAGEFSLDYNPLQEFDEFNAVFTEYVRFSRRPAEVKRDHALAALRATLDERLPQLATAASVREEVAAEEALQHYLETVMRQCSGVMLSPLDQAGQERRYMTLDHLFINLNAGSDRGAHAPGDRQGETFSAAVGHVFANRRLILLGDPGSGKTTVLRYLGLCLAGARAAPDAEWLERLQWTVRTGQMLTTTDREEVQETVREVRHWTGDAPIPIMVTLRNFASDPIDVGDPLAIWHHVSTTLEREGHAAALPALTRRVQRGEALFLFDGVDEVPGRQRAAVWQSIAALDKSICGGNRWVTTCRNLSFDDSELSETGIPVRTMQSLNRAQIDGFVVRWFERMAAAGEMTQAEAAAKTEQLQAAVQQDHLFPLASNPMLLTIMALVQAYYGTLPHERAKLYRACVETLLVRWQQHKDRSNSTLPKVLEQLAVAQPVLERLMEEIGWEVHRQASGDRSRATIGQADLIQLVYRELGSYAKAEVFVKYTEERAHLLIGLGVKDEPQYSFVHRTFQEYLAACKLASLRRFGHEARDLIVEAHTWRETLVLAVGELYFNRRGLDKAMDGIAVLRPDTAPLPVPGDAAQWRRVWLAGEMLAVVGSEAARGDEVGAKLVGQLPGELAALLTGGELTTQQRAATGLALGKLNDPRPDVMTVDGMRFCLVPRGPFVMGSDDEVLRYTTDYHEDIRPTRHENAIDYDYWIGQYPVTNAQYTQFVAAGGYDDAAFWPEAAAAGVWRDGVFAGFYWNGEKYVQGTGTRAYDYGEPFNLPNHPVVGVSWYEALAFCRWLEGTLRAQGALPEGWRVLLPSEPEWEKAARGGVQMPEKALVRTVADGFAVTETGKFEDNPLPERTFPWGDRFDGECANRELDATSAVGAFPRGASPYGVQELSGNAWEWTRSLWGHYDTESGKFDQLFTYPYVADDGREALAADYYHPRVLRGGAWGNAEKWLRCAARNGNYPLNGSNDYGLRLVLSPLSSSDL